MKCLITQELYISIIVPEEWKITVTDAVKCYHVFRFAATVSHGAYNGSHMKKLTIESAASCGVQADAEPL